ncbi:elongation factor P [Fimbriimonadia bacterium ATM]|nr:MAG: elongation factor P [Armatimonadota bacterium]MBC6969533.1 elongation factor P [Armatimonadota bacterium]MCE7899129.1 elongation factor P [Armatimonadetes bacterium ATM1]MDL1929460.1 elongation factor P [Fimbriimonadia bacterium ATM]RIJ97198.1 MAG: elongation factor P [Armatimonadota bacterium]
MLAIDTSDFKTGMSIYLDGEVFTVVEFQHVKPGKGGAFVRTKLRKLKTGQNIEKTFRAGERIEPAYVERKKMQFLYAQGDEVTLMDLDDYDQVAYSKEMFGGGAKYLIEGMEVSAVTVDGNVVALEVPNFVELRVVETDPAFKGDTVSGGSKPATLEGGAVVAVPFHIGVGDLLKVDTRTDTYLERVKSAE